MEEIIKKIKKESEEIELEQEKLSYLEERSKKLQNEAKEIKEERNEIEDIESGFYKDLSKKFEEKDKEFREADIERMDKDKYINELISSKKKTIVEEIKEKMKYIDENRNVSLDGVDVKKLKDEKVALEKEIKLNDTTKEEFLKLSDSDKQAVRKAKENYLNNKHRLDAINPTIKLADTLEGKEHKDKFREMEALLKTINDNFDKNNIGKLLENIKEYEKDNYREENGFEEPETYDSNYKEHSQGKDTKNKMLLDIDGNKININKNIQIFYAEEIKNKKDIKEKYEVSSYFENNKKNEKLVDYALISALEKIDDKDGSLVKAYLNVIRDGKSQSDEVKESIEKLNNAVDIKYKFNKENGILLHRKEKKIARYAKKMGIATLDGISEKSLWEKISDKAKEMVSKIKNTKLLKGKKEPKALESGEKTKEPENENFRSEYEVDEKVKNNINNVSKRYSEQEKEENVKEEEETLEK